MRTAMLQAHSYLWHYLWVAPNLLLLFLGFLLRKRKLHKQIPAFLAFCLVAAIGELAIYSADISTSISPTAFWRMYWGNALLQGLLKIFVIGEVFVHLIGPYVSIARLGRRLVRAVTAVVLLAATFVAAYAPRDGSFGIVSGAHFLEQTTYLIECGLLVFIFAFTAYFRMSWDRRTFGISLGLSISACVHLGVWAVLANAGLSDSARNMLVFAKMATYHLCVLIWFYYLLVPSRSAVRPTVLPTDSNLALWNRELERLLQ